MKNAKEITLLSKLESLKETLLLQTLKAEPILEKLQPARRNSAMNFIQYLAARSTDLRSLQDELHALGLSSLASSESHFLLQVQQVIHWLKSEPVTPLATSPELNKNAKKLFGESVNKFVPQIMVTYDSQFADDNDLIIQLINQDMRIARINCAHDEEAAWLKMIENTKAAANLAQRKCKIYMDLPGPKIRTSILGKGKKANEVKLEKGEFCWLVEDGATFKKRDKVIGISSNGILAQLKKGERVLFDDGIIEAIVEEVQANKLLLKIKRVSSKKGTLKAEKGINFPGTELELDSLTPFDEACLPFIVANADMLGYSFVQDSHDIHLLYQKLARLGKPNFPVILKIETKAAVLNLPQLLLTAMEYEAPAVMIARGDLAIEIGFERLSEIQDEIIWLCEAAHTPVIWATQVLENLNKTGFPTRSEVTDAAHASMAECVMINKGTHMVEAVKTLIDILNKSGRHHWKKRNMMRPLKIAESFFQQSGLS